MNSFMIAFNCIVPFLVYMSFGYVAKRMNICDEAFLKRLNQLIFKLFYPVMMFYNVNSVEFSSAIDFKLLLTEIIFLFMLVVGLILLVPKFNKDKRQCGVIIQAIFRSNVLLFAIPMVTEVFGESYVGLVSLVLAVVVPIYNVTAVIVLELFRGNKVEPKKMIKSILTNPLIIGCAIGLVFALLHIQLPSCVDKPLKNLTNVCTPLGMFVLGGTISITEIKKNFKILMGSLFIKMVVLPAIVLSITYYLGYTPIQLFVLLILYATPISTASYSMAQNMGGDEALAGEFVAVSTILSLGTLFMWIMLLSSIGIF
ncbi:MAG: AEC family transporter [Erysipelotrichaceae bacterium]|nr:AEC family transporter [Erysipelotrichaceae bacterium]